MAGGTVDTRTTGRRRRGQCGLVDRHAVRTASFSLYLAMCDEIDPRHYWTQVRFPNLRDRCLVSRDFFSEEDARFRTNEDAGLYDIVVGNALWGKGTINESSPARGWAKQYEWPVSYGDIGPLFLAKSAALVKTIMLGYLLRGCPEAVFRGISDRLACRLQPWRKFDPVRHRVSVHDRELENPDFLSGAFWCHHLVMKMYP